MLGIGVGLAVIGMKVAPRCSRIGGYHDFEGVLSARNSESRVSIGQVVEVVRGELDWAQNAQRIYGWRAKD
jgi:hypothetical protein